MMLVLALPVVLLALVLRRGFMRDLVRQNLNNALSPATSGGGSCPARTNDYVTFNIIDGRHVPQRVSILLKRMFRSRCLRIDRFDGELLLWHPHIGLPAAFTHLPNGPWCMPLVRGHLMLRDHHLFSAIRSWKESWEVWKGFGSATGSHMTDFPNDCL